ncbi:MAG: outer membrane protein assembly factor BamB, partial [Rhodothermales bacterium]
TPLTLPMNLLWQVQNTAPKPAWPPPAKQDFWNKKAKLPPRVTYDRVDHVVAANNRVVQGSSAADHVTCRDLVSGVEQWRFVSEGPVRVAPSIAGERVVFGSDDGYVYCLNITDGTLLWRQAAAEETLRIPGNGRIISTWPVRGSPLVHKRLVHACAGVFPEQGVYRVSLDLETGKLIQRQALRASAQGYLARNGARLVVPTGRDPKGATVTALRGRTSKSGQTKTPAPFDLASISAGELRIGGGADKVAVFDAQDKILWESPVAGRALGLAICDDRLLVSTDSGKLYAFGQGHGVASTAAVAPASSPTRGYQLHIGPNPPTSDLRIIHAVVDSAETRRAASQRAGYGQRLVVHELQHPLPYGDYLFNRIEASGDAIPDAELMRVLRPGGIAIINGQEQRRPALDGIGEWTHLYGNAANTACSGDSLVGGKMALQWFGEPGPEKMLDRHHRTVAPLSKNGRLIVPGDNRLFGVDAYNGTVWWERELPDSRRAAAFRDCGGMALTEGQLYAAAGASCIVIHPETGDTIATLSVPTQERDWGYVASVDGRLFGSSTRRSASRRGHSRATIGDTYFDFRPLVTSDSAFAFGSDHKLLWEYQPLGAIVNPSFTVAGDLLCFAESASAKTLEAENGRASPRALFGEGSRLVALDVATGKPRWTRKLNAEGIAHASYLAYSDGKLVLTGSLNSSSDRKTAKLLYQIWVFDASDGSLLWETTQTQGTRIGGDHGEQDHHPVIVGDRLICEPHAYSLSSGSPLDDWGWSKSHRRGCGTISASLSTLFYRQGNPSRFELASNTTAKVTAVTRPGCWINMIPAGGLLLIPEASSGCSCNFGVQSSLAFRPIPAN